MKQNIKYNKKVDLILDLQYGSTGKGKVAGFIAATQKPDVVVNSNMPNAGHTYIDTQGNKYIQKVLPNGIVSPNLNYCLLGSGSVFSIERLQFEIEVACGFLNISQEKFISMLKIHENSVILTEKHAEEESSFSRIGSTQQGSAAALMDKMSRDPKADVIARDVLKGTKWDKCLCSNNKYLRILYDADYVLAEGAQGFSLGLSQPFYPYCTSRDCTPERLLADMNIPLSLLKSTIGVMRPYPIRVSGTSGGQYKDQWETSWEKLKLAPEFTTVTKRKRRVFTFSNEQFEEAVMACVPDIIFLNFSDYLSFNELISIRTQCLNVLSEIRYPKEVTWAYGTGAGHNALVVIDINNLPEGG